MLCEKIIKCIAEKETVKVNADKPIFKDCFNPKVLPEMENVYNILMLNGLQMIQEIPNCSI
jgi:hypothetical protein